MASFRPYSEVINLVLLFKVSGTFELGHNKASGWINSAAATSPLFKMIFRGHKMQER
jgi:hypothetical protein